MNNLVRRLFLTLCLVAGLYGISELGKQEPLGDRIAEQIIKRTN